MRKNVDSPWLMVDRDDDGWLVPRRSIPLPLDPRVDKFKSLDAIVINKNTGNIEFIFNPQTEQDPEALAVLTAYDLLEMMEKNIRQAFFSLDPVEGNMHYHPFNTMRFGPSNIYQTQFLNTLLITDYLLKFFTVNREVQARDKFATRSLDSLTKTLPKFLKDIIDEFQTDHSEEAMHRFWIAAEETPAILSEEDDMLKLHVGEVRMVVKKHALRRDADGKLVDKDEDDEGWSVYVYANTGGKIHLSQKEIICPAIICIKGENKIYFYERGVVSPPVQAGPGIEQEKLEEIWELERDKTDKVLLGSAGSKVSCQVYSFVRDCTERASKPHYYSKEYVFAQEFTMNYDLFALHFAEFGRLKELSKVTALIKLLNAVVASNKQTVAELEEKLRKADNDPFWKETTAKIKQRFIEVNLPKVKQSLQRFIDNNPKVFSKSWFSWFESKEHERARHCAVYEAFADVQKEAEQAGFEYAGAVLYDFAVNSNIERMAELIVAAKVPQAVVDCRKEMREAVVSLQKLNQELARLGIKDEEPKEVDLTGKCLWVPANINHNEKESRVVYGGVLVQPTIRFLQKGTPQYTSLAASTYSGRHNALDRTYLDRARQESALVRSTVPLPTYLFGQEVAKRTQAAAAAAATRTAPAPAPAAARPTAFTPAPGPAAKPAAVVRPTAAPAPAPAPVRATAASAAAGGASRGGPPPAAAAAGAGAQGGARGNMGGGGGAGAAGSGGGRGPGNAGGHVGVARSRSPDAPSAADAVRLRTVLALKENGILDAGGKLTQQAIDRSFLALPDDTVLGNPSVVTELTKDGSKVTDWRKMTTESTGLATGQRIQVHFYQNRVTGEVNYTHQDFKVKNPVKAFDVFPSEEAKSKTYRPACSHDALSRYKK